MNGIFKMIALHYYREFQIKQMNPIWYDQINFKLSIIERKTTELGSILTCRSLLPSQ